MPISDSPFVLNSEVTIRATGDEMVRNADVLAGYIKQATGIDVDVNGTGEKYIRLKADLNDVNPEAYEITVNKDSVVINGASAAGMFHGMQTVRKSITQHLSGITAGHHKEQVLQVQRIIKPIKRRISHHRMLP